MACAGGPFAPLRRTMRFDVSGVDNRGLARPSALDQGGQHRPPEAAPGPAVEAVINGRARIVVCRTAATEDSATRWCGFDPKAAAPRLFGHKSALRTRHRRAPARGGR